MPDTRHPYTNSCDLLRMLGPKDGISPAMSRSDASQFRTGLAKALGMTDEALAIKLSDYFKENETALVASATASIAAILGAPHPEF